MMLLAINWGCFLAGTWIMQARHIAGYCHCLLQLPNVAAILTISTFRANEWGHLSALCDGPSKFVDDDGGILNLSDEYTVAGDASIIAGILVGLSIFCITSNCHCAYAAKETWSP